MAKKIVFVGVISFLLWPSTLFSRGAKMCINENSCSCKLEEYVEINLAPLNTQQLQDTEGNVTYFFMGCEDKVLGNNIFGIKTNETASLFRYEIVTKNNNTIDILTAVGRAKDIKFEADANSKYVLAYKEKESKSAPTIHLVCTDYETSELKIGDPTSNTLILFSPFACKLTLDHGMSIGSVLIIIIIVGTMVYFALGSFVLYFVRGARGVEIIPNFEFWKGLPGLIKEGIIFVFNGCKPTFVSTADTYDRI